MTELLFNPNVELITSRGNKRVNRVRASPKTSKAGRTGENQIFVVGSQEKFVRMKREERYLSSGFDMQHRPEAEREAPAQTSVVVISKAEIQIELPELDAVLSVACS